ncbi:outer membrane beta-barrel protein [Paraburkholderia sp. A1RI_3L]|uniref:outer membrane beta-barrel protein n=1 Tax=Paraburkholderia TaxID=1822464 RepID=UPI003B8154F7
MSREKLTTNRAGWSGKSSGNAALGAHGGYQFSRYFAVEGGVSSLGQVEATSGGRKDKFTLGAVSANLVGYLPVTDRFSVLGIIGAGWEVGRRRGDVESRNASAGFLNAGLGAAYDVSPYCTCTCST